MMRISQHWTDIAHPTDSSKRIRTIKSWMNFRVPGSDYATTNAKTINAQGNPPNWVGAFDFSFASLDAPLQVFARDAMDVSNRAMVGVRHSENPSAWLNMKAIDGSSVDAVVTNDGKKITYPSLWPGCDLVYDIYGATLKETVVIWNKLISPAYFEWSLKYGPGYDLNISNNVIGLVGRESGESFIKSNYPSGWDDNESKVRCSITEEGINNGLRVIRLTPNNNDIASAVGTIYLDPTLEITGTTDIDDSWIRSTEGNTNMGTFADIRADSNNIDYGLFRVNTSALPVGIYTSAVVNLYVRFGDSVRLRRILPGSYNWGEGVGALSPANNGEVTWNNMRHNEDAWAGSAGCGTEGTDYTFTDETLFSSVSGQYNAITVPEDFFTNWADGTYSNGGWVIHSNTGGVRFDSAEGTNPPSVDLIYSEVTQGSTFFMIGF